MSDFQGEGCDLMAADHASIEYKSKSVKAVLADIAGRYGRETGSTRNFVFIENVGFAEVVPESGKRVRRGLQGEIREAAVLLDELVVVLRKLAAEPDLDATYNSIRVRQLLKAAQVAYYNVSHRMMQDLLSVSPRSFTSVASLYNDVTNFQKLINAVRYGETERSFADPSVVKLARRIGNKAPKVSRILADFGEHAGGTAGEELFGEHNIMAYRYRGSVFVNVELLLAYLGIDPAQDKRLVAREIREQEDAVLDLLGAVEKSGDGGGTELLSPK